MKPTPLAQVHLRLERVAPDLSEHDRRAFVCVGLLNLNLTVDSLTELSMPEVQRLFKALCIPDAKLVGLITEWKTTRAAEQISIIDLLEVAQEYPEMPECFAEAALEYQREKIALVAPPQKRTTDALRNYIFESVMQHFGYALDSNNEWQGQLGSQHAENFATDYQNQLQTWTVGYVERIATWLEDGGSIKGVFHSVPETTSGYEFVKPMVRFQPKSRPEDAIASARAWDLLGVEQEEMFA